MNLTLLQTKNYNATCSKHASAAFALATSYEEGVIFALKMLQKKTRCKKHCPHETDEIKNVQQEMYVSLPSRQESAGHQENRIPAHFYVGKQPKPKTQSTHAVPRNQLSPAGATLVRECVVCNSVNVFGWKLSTRSMTSGSG